MRVLLDTNVVLDVLIPRPQWFPDAEPIWRASTEGRLVGYITASSLTDIYYLSRRLTSAVGSRRIVRLCLDNLELLTVDRAALEAAYNSPTSDFEDALQIATAEREGLDAIVTRDPEGFALSPIEVLSPPEMLARLQSV
jgi:predicted nucleic acid-binding protein